MNDRELFIPFPPGYKFRKISRDVFMVIQRGAYRHSIVCISDTEKDAENLFWELYEHYKKNPRKGYHQIFDGHYTYEICRARTETVDTSIVQEPSGHEDIVEVIRAIDYPPIKP